VSVSCVGKHKITSLRFIKAGSYEVLYLAKFSSWVTSIILPRRVTSAYPGARVVCSRLVAGITGSNPAEGIDVGLLFVLCR
jgi:hypothetical protein